MERLRLAVRALGAVSVLSLGAFGCAAPIAADVDAGSTQRLSLVEVRATHAAADGALVRLDASARFVNVREPGLPSDALDLLGLGWPSITPGTCAAASETAQPTQTFRVDLRDLSPVDLEVRSDDGVATPFALEPRAFPDVVGLVSGVVFVAPSSATPVTSAKSVTLSAGGFSLGGFELPEAPHLDLIGASPVGSDGASFSLSSPNGVDLVDSSPRAGDRVLVDVIRAGVVKSRCVLGEGRLHLDGPALGGIGDTTLLVRAQRRAFRDGETGPVEARLERDVEVHLVVR